MTLHDYYMPNKMLMRVLNCLPDTPSLRSTGEDPGLIGPGPADWQPGPRCQWAGGPTRTRARDSVSRVSDGAPPAAVTESGWH